MDLKVLGMSRALRRVHDIQRQGRFALSLAMNNTLKEVQGWTTNELLPGAFILRSRGAPWWKPRTRFGFNIKFANKNNLTARLGSRADWLKLQERGGTKKAAGHRIAIPTQFWKPKPRIIEKSKKPRAILGRNKKGLDAKPFVYEGAKMPPGIYARKGPERSPLWMLFHFVDSARIRAALDFEDQAADRFGRLFPDEFAKAFRHALATAK